ncbi:MAG: 30S ribosomal protein S1 [Dehalococcoidia bacterium]
MVESDFDTYSESMSDLPEDAFSPRRYQPGEVVEGEVVRVDDDGIVVSVGLKTEGMVPPQEMRTLSLEDKARLQSGDKLMVTLVSGRGPGDMAVLSLDRAVEERRWREVQEHLDQGTTITAKIVDQNRGGVVVDCHGVRGFVPFSQLAPMPNDSKEEILASRMGEEATFNVLEVDRRQGRLVLSERALWQQKREEAKRQFISEMEEGSLVTGKVSSMRGFGAFVNLGAADGLIPISELSWTMIKGPEEVVSLGQEVEVQVLKVDPEAGRITLSLKRTQPEPWETVPERYNAGQVVEGTVTRMADFGVFVKLEDWVEGLVHISELSNREVRNPKECVYLNQKIQVMILDIDPAKRRISLSYKKAFGM